MLSRYSARFVPLALLPLVLACGSVVQHAAQNRCLNQLRFRSLRQLRRLWFRHLLRLRIQPLR